jgi:hypothetical protein
MIDALKNIMNLQRMTANEFRDRTSEFATWISIFGSDEAVKAFHDFMQASYHAAPPAVLMKLYADFVISARRDMGYPNTEIKQSHFVGIRISDLYDNNILKDINKPLADICREAQWTPPWPHAEA